MFSKTPLVSSVTKRCLFAVFSFTKFCQFSLLMLLSNQVVINCFFGFVIISVQIRVKQNAVTALCSGLTVAEY